MGHALSGTQEHLVEAMVVPLLKITKTMLSELLDSGSTEVRDFACISGKGWGGKKGICFSHEILRLKQKDPYTLCLFYIKVVLIFTLKPSGGVIY